MAIDLTTLGASDGTGESVQASVTAIRAPGASTIVVDSLAHWPAKFIATTSRLITVSTGSGTTQTILDPSRILVFNGHSSSGQIIIDSLAPGYVDTYGSSVNDVVVIKPTTLWADTIQGALQVSNNTNGTLKDAIVTTPKIADGAVTIAKTASNPYRFSVYRNSAAAYSVGAAAIIHDTVLFDPSSNYSVINGRYTITQPGYYAFQARASVVSSARTIVSIYKNGVELFRGNDISGTVGGIISTPPINLVATDYIQTYIYVGTNTSLEVGQATVWFGGWLVSTT